MNCSRCNAPVPEGARFCTSCGSPLQKPAAVPPPSLGFPDIRVEEPKPITLSPSMLEKDAQPPLGNGAPQSSPGIGASQPPMGGAPVSVPPPVKPSATMPQPSMGAQPSPGAVNNGAFAAPSAPHPASFTPPSAPFAAQPIPSAPQPAPAAPPAPSADPRPAVSSQEPKPLFEMPQVPEAPWAAPELSFGATGNGAGAGNQSASPFASAGQPEAPSPFDTVGQGQEENPWSTDANSSGSFNSSANPQGFPGGDSTGPQNMPGGGASFGETPFEPMQPKPSILWLILNSVFLVLGCCVNPISSLVFLAGVICAAIAQSKKGPEADGLNKVSMILFFVGLGLALLLLVISVVSVGSRSFWDSLSLDNLSADELPLLLSFLR